MAHGPQGWRWIGLGGDDALRPHRRCRRGARHRPRHHPSQRLAEEHFLKLSYAVEQSPVSVIITDADGRFQYVNPRIHPGLRLHARGDHRAQPAPPARGPCDRRGLRRVLGRRPLRPRMAGGAQPPAPGGHHGLGVGAGLLAAQRDRRDHEFPLPARGHHRAQAPRGAAAASPEDGEPGHPAPSASPTTSTICSRSSTATPS